MGNRKSLHGKAVMYDDTTIYVNGRPIGLPTLNKGAKYIFVDSNVDAIDGSSPDGAVGTLDEAVNMASEYDAIIVMPGHDETLAAASGADVDVAGLHVLGLGTGSNQPIFRFTATASTFDVGAADVVLENLHFIADVSGVVKGIDVQDGSDDYKILGCRFTCNTLTTDEFNDAIFVTTADRGEIAGCYFDMDEAAAQSAIHLVGACLGADIHHNTVLGDYAVGCIEGVTAAAEQVIIRNNTLVNGVHSGLNTVACISLYTGTTGFIQNNMCYTNVTGAMTAAIDADGCFFGGGNFVASSAETAPKPIEGGTSQIIRSAVATGAADETDGLGLFTVTGEVYIHGITQRAEVAANSAVSLGIQVDATDATRDMVLVTDTALTTETSVGDYAVSNSAGGAFTVVQVESTTNSVMWDTPVVVPAGSIEQAASGTPGALVSGYIIYWSEATPGATLVAA